MTCYDLEQRLNEVYRETANAPEGRRLKFKENGPLAEIASPCIWRVLPRHAWPTAEVVRSSVSWILPPDTRASRSGVGGARGSGKLDRNAAKSLMLDVLRTRVSPGELPLANADMPETTRLDRQPVNRLIHRLADDGQLGIEGHGRVARYAYVGPLDAPQRE